MKQTILLIADSMRSGKSTVADYLVSHCGFAKFSIAEAIKKATVALLQECGYTQSEANEMCFGSQKEDIIPILSTTTNQVTSRRILQLFGTEVRELIFDTEVWLRILNRKAQDYDKIVVDDVRYQHEIDFFKRQGYNVKVVRVKRPDAIVQPSQKHSSEGGLVNYHEDILIENNGTLEDLKKKIQDIFV